MLRNMIWFNANPPLVDSGSLHCQTIRNSCPKNLREDLG